LALPSSPWLRNASNIYFSTGNVGINTVSPQADLHVDGEGLFDFYSGTFRISTPGSWPGIISYIQTGERRDIAFRDYGISILSSTTSAAPGLLDGLWVLPGGNVGIKSWNPGNYPLLVNETTEWGLALRNSNGNIWELFSSSDGGLYLYRQGSTLRGSFDGATGTYTPVSDRRFKANIEPLNNTMTNVKKIRPSSYTMKSRTNGQREIGLVAQELKSCFPELVYEIIDEKIGRKVYTVNYNGIAVVAVKAIQEQQEIIDSQAETIDKLSDRIGDLERRLESLQRGMKRLRRE